MNLGIIGCGQMGKAIAAGVLQNETLRKAFPLYAYARNEDTRASLCQAGAFPLDSSENLASAAEIIVVAVKPYQIVDVLREIRPVLRENKLVVSVAAGVRLATLREACGGACPVTRIMPNTLVAVGKGLFGICHDDAVSKSQQAAVHSLFSGLGMAVELPESRMNAFSALAGCGPAYVFYMVDALVEAGVSMGLSRETSREIALSLCAGCAALATEKGLHPVLLREQVTSPGGMTVAGTNHLDRAGVRGAIIDAVLAAEAKGNTLG